ncbi:MAG TPA: N,N-dimethylformamidase beta subunit family domain-containing protein [Candidatus Acidoferrum sp.]|nr:N,N-dimethylformamidase beta subunit family domain-containing protein [Candidatus Acidoferrum sp.]
MPGTPASQWYVQGAGSPNIQGFATDISVNVGQTVFFKIATNASTYRIDIYRLGYYQGNGARLVASVSPSVPLPQVQPGCLTNASTGITDCGNWAVTASWAVPSTATSGVYFANLVRLDTAETGVVVFVVRNDSSHSDILVQTCDPTWHAYNDYGGSSLYAGPTTRAFKVSYNRPFNVPNPSTWFFSAEYPMWRWLEANGYDVSYFAGVDTDRNGALIKQHKIFMSVGHDEYWSGRQRANVEAARAAGVNLAFFSGNEIFWKTRWEPSIDGANTAYRTLVCYKETLANVVIDPQDPPTWTGIWRDPRFSPPADGGRPENSLSGTLFWVNAPRTDPIFVPQADGRMRFWRNTSIASLAPGQVATLPTGTLGYEWDVDADNGFRPAGLVSLSTTTLTVPTCILGYTIGTCTATHHLTLYRASSGALVFGAGTVQWSWGLDATHTNAGAPADPNMQQATVNLLADMGVQPATLQSGVVPATPSTDSAPPRSTIVSPALGTIISAGSPVTISGSAVDFGGGVVGAVEVSPDGGKTWHPAVGRENWSYTLVAGNSGPLTIQSRAADDSGNLEVPGPGSTVTAIPQTCPCTIWPSTATPTTADAGSNSPLELGVQFRSDSSGYITGIRFYKSAANTGTHVGNLWNSLGVLLASATFTGESSLGWQQVNFSNPVAITANTVYVASYHTNVGHFSDDLNYFVASGVDNAPLHALANGAGGANGVYAFGSTSVFPANGYNSSNFWVDAVFNSNFGGSLPLSVSTTSLPNGTQSLAYNRSLAAVGGAAPYSWSLPSGTLPSGLTLSSSGQVSGTPTSVATSSFTVQVTDSSVPAQAATQALSITIAGPTDPPNNAELNGNYAFTFNGTNGSSAGSFVFAAVGRFTADGAGNLTNGELDTNTVGGGAAAQAFTGTYSIGADNRGVMTLNISGSTARLAFAMMANGNAQFIEFDTGGGSGTIGSGTMEKADTTAYSTAGITGDYAFGAAGLDNANNRAAIAGRFTSNGTGTLSITAGDFNAYGTDYAMNFTAANYTVSDTATGRGTMNLAFTFGGTPDSLNFVFYIVNSGKLFVMESDPVSTATPLLNGEVIQQQLPAGGFTNSSLNGNMVIYLTGLSSCSSGLGVPKAGAGLFTADGSGAFSLTYDENFCGAPNSFTAAPGTYSVAGNGRTSISIGGFSLVAYLSNLNQAFLFVSDVNVLFGFGEPQAPGSFNNAALNGTYAGFATNPAAFGVTAFSGEFSADGITPTGTMTGTQDIGTPSGPNPGVAFSATYSIIPSPTNGRGTMTVTSGTGGNAVIYMVSPSKFVAVSLSDPNPAVLDFELSSTPASVSLSSVSLNPATVTGGNSSTGTVTLGGPAPSVGAQVTLSSANTAAASVPSTVTVVAGASSATFPVSTSAVAASTTVTISASYGGVTQTASLTVTAAPDYTLSTSPTILSITQGTSGTSTMTVTPQNGFSGGVSLSASGLPNGVTASFSSNPATATSTLTLAVSSAAAIGTVTATITGTSAALTHTTAITMTVTPAPAPTLTSLTLNPTSVVGGLQSSTGTVTLSGPAPSVGAQVTLSSASTAAASVPSTVTVAAGASSATFPVSTSAAASSTTVTISATYSGVTRSALLTVNPQPNYALSASPSSVTIVQGGSGASTITVTPQNGFSSSVTLSASGLPSGVTATFSPNPATATSTLTLAVSGAATTGMVTATITGTASGLTRSTTISLTVNPIPLPTLSSLTLNPTSVIGGAQSSRGTVTLSGPAPPGGAQVTLSNSGDAASVPSSVIVPAGATSATFTVNTSVVLVSTSATISASYNNTTQTASLAVLL